MTVALHIVGYILKIVDPLTERVKREQIFHV